jgi:putative two-component system response regulator
MYSFSNLRNEIQNINETPSLYEINYSIKNEEKKKILIVDDVSINIDILSYCLGEEYNISASQDSQIALNSIDFEKPSIIILDLYMPEVDGFEFCRRVKSSQDYRDIPIIFITSDTEPATLSKAFAIGAVDYITKPISPLEVRARIKTHLKLKAAEDALREQNHHLEIKVEQRTRKVQEKQNEINEVQREAILRLCLAAELRDKGTGMHIRRIQEYSALLGRKCCLSEEHVELIHLASAMHDLGKIGIPDSVLLKPGKLNAEEWAIMRSHTIIGAKSLANSRFRLIQLAESIAHFHHERWDGTGYPEGLKDTEIPLKPGS